MRTALSLASPVIVCIAGLLTVLLIVINLQNGNLPMLPVSTNKEINFSWTMQLMTLPVSFAAIALAFLINPENAKMFFRFTLRAGPNDNTDWNFGGPAVLIVFALGTVMFMAIPVASNAGEMNAYFLKLLPMVFLFAFT